MTVRLLLVDDHPVVLGGLAAGLNQQDDLCVVATAGSVAQAVTALAQHRVDVALVDIRLPDGSGLELLTSKQAHGQGPAWIVLSSFETPQYLRAAFKLGAAGYLLKTAPLDDLAAAIRRVADGGVAFDAGQFAAIRTSDDVHLTMRERTIVKALLAGRSNDEIAAELGVARKTVEAHLTRLFARFEVATRTELALRADRDRWLDMPG